MCVKRRGRARLQHQFSHPFHVHCVTLKRPVRLLVHVSGLLCATTSACRRHSAERVTFQARKLSKVATRKHVEREQCNAGRCCKPLLSTSANDNLYAGTGISACGVVLRQAGMRTISTTALRLLDLCLSRMRDAVRFCDGWRHQRRVSLLLLAARACACCTELQ